MDIKGREQLKRNLSCLLNGSVVALVVTSSSSLVDLVNNFRSSQSTVEVNGLGINILGFLEWVACCDTSKQKFSW